MKLLLDAGNTRVKIGWLQADGSREPQVTAFPHDDIQTTLPDWLGKLPERPQAALGVNVGGTALGDTLVRIVADHAGCATHWQMSTPGALGLSNGYANPAQLGCDRWLAMLGLWAHPSHRQEGAMRPVQVLASFGTATTIDTLSPQGRFEGGLILPGLQLMLDSLARGTANLPRAGGLSALFPTDTNQAIASGVLAAQAGAILRQLLAARERFPAQTLRLAVTGGAWPDIQPELMRLLDDAGIALAPWIMDNPVLDGLAMLAAQTPDITTSNSHA